METPEQDPSAARATRSSTRMKRRTEELSLTNKTRKPSEDTTGSPARRRRKKSDIKSSEKNTLSQPGPAAQNSKIEPSKASASSPKEESQTHSPASPSTTGRSSGGPRRRSITRHAESKDDSDPLDLPIKPTPTMDVSVHRMRNLHYVPKPILCLATTPFDCQAADYVACSRDNGHVELRCPDEKWRSVAIVTGYQSRTVDAMAWTCGACDTKHATTLGDKTEQVGEGVTYSSTFHQSHSLTHARRTLVGASRDGTIFVVDFRTGRIVAVTGSGGGGVFSLASLCGNTCCSSRNHGCSEIFAAGCEDGSVRIYKINREQHHEKLELVSTVPCAGAAILSLSWRRHSSDTTGRGMRGTVLYAGIADGTIRRYDCESVLGTARLTGTSAHTISTGTSVMEERWSGDTATWKATLRMTVESYGRATPTRVWALEAMSDGTVVTADSLGHIQFWDGMNGTLVQSFDQNDNKADVLTLAVNAEECQVYASGVDSRVVCIERPPLGPEGAAPKKIRRWVMTHAQRPHTHDVKSIVVCRLQDTSGKIKARERPSEILCSGGIDTKLCTYLMKDFRKVRPKNWYPWPSISPISVASEARVLIMTRDDRVDFYRVAKVNAGDEFPVLVSEENTRIGSVEIQGSGNLVCSAISMDGKHMAVSDSASVTLFRLIYASGTALPSRVTLPPQLLTPCVALRFTSDGRLVMADIDGRILISNIGEKPDGNAVVSLEAEFKSRSEDCAISVIRELHVTDDGQWLASTRSSLGSDAVHVYSIAEGNYRYWWTLPPLEAPVSSVRFVGEGVAQLVVGCTNFSFYVFDVEQRKLGNWSQTNVYPLSPALPPELKHRSDYPVRFARDPGSPHRFLMGSFGAFSVVDMEQTIPKHCRVFPETHVRGRKRKRASDDTEDIANRSNCMVCLRYNSMLYMDFVAENELLVVEEPWLNVVASFPEALERKMYGS